MPARTKFVRGLVAMTAALRLTPYLLTAYDAKVDPTVLFYPWNFMPLMALCLYSGAYVTNRRLSVVLPILALLISDLGIWAVTGEFSWAFPSDRWSAYVCNTIAIFMGRGLSSRTWPVRGLDAFGRGIAAEVLFFIVTNFAYFTVQSDLPHSLSGLVACYVAAIPFAWKSFASTAFYSVLLFSPVAVRAAGESNEMQVTRGFQPTR